MRPFCYLAGLFVLLPAAAWADVPFTLDSVGPAVTANSISPSLVYVDGIPRLSLNGFSSGRTMLLYAEKPGAAWTIETADTAAGSWSSLAFDSKGEPHISYCGRRYDVNYQGDLLYARKSRGAWLTTVVDSTGLTGACTSLAIDSQDVPHISYYTYAYINEFEEIDMIGNLAYATLQPGNPPQWIWEYVDEPGDVGLFTSLELDASGNPCISYFDLTNGDLKFARKENGVWTKEVVVHIKPPYGTYEHGWHTSLEIDSNGNYHISYLTRTIDYPLYHLGYAVKLGGVWATEVADPTSNVGWYSSLTLDSQNRPWISYMEQQPNWWDTNLRLATKQGGVWTHQTVDATERTGTYTSITLDSQGLPWIAYYSETAQHIQVAIPNVGAVGVGPFVAETPFVGTPYPNPSRGAFTFTLQLPETESARLTLFDVGGRIISQIPTQQGGSRVVTWNPRDIESGVYFLRVESSSGIHETRQVTLIR